VSMSEQHNKSRSMNFRQKLLYCVGREHYVSLIVIYVMMIMMAGFEVLCATLFLPFLAIVENSSKINEYAWLEYALGWYGKHDAQSAIIVCCVLLLISYLLKNTFNLLYQYNQAKFIRGAQAKLALKLLRKYLHSDYIVHISRNSGELIRNINQDTHSVYNNVIRSLLLVMVEGVIALGMLGLLLVRNVSITLLAIAIFGTLGVVVYRTSQRYTYSYGNHVRGSMAEMIKWTIQSLGALKETKVMNKEDYFLARYGEHVDRYKHYAVKYAVIYEVPRMSIEVLGIFTVLLMTLVLLQQASSEDALPTLGLFAVVAFRTLPSLTRITSGLSLIRFHHPALDNVVNDLLDDDLGTSADDDKQRLVQEITFEDRITLESVEFAYDKTSSNVLNGCSLHIPRGASVAFVGASGAGKTTLIDLLLGLLSPDAGDIKVDGVSIQGNEQSWQRQVGYISQPVYMLNDTIRRNVAFGVFDDEIDDDRVWNALKQAQLDDVVRGLSEGLDTSIGESGVKLSGGQRQRLGIARVLYRDPEVLIFDEATSALDNETEAEITRAIEGLSREKTIVLIAHRFSTIEHCDTIFMLEHGRVLASGSYQELLDGCEPFYKLAMASVRNSGGVVLEQDV